MAFNNFSKQVPNYCMFYENHTKSKEATTRYVTQTYLAMSKRIVSNQLISSYSFLSDKTFIFYVFLVLTRLHYTSTTFRFNRIFEYKQFNILFLVLLCLDE